MFTKSHSFKIVLFIHVSMILFSNIYTSYAQRVEKFSNLEGFNQNTVNTIVRDSYGFLWIGTPNGLIKYDGYDFEDIKTDFSSNINKLHINKKNQLWIGTHHGVLVKLLSQNKEFKVPFHNKLTVTNIISDDDGNVWVSGGNKLFVCKLIDQQKGTFEISENLLEKHPKISQINDFTFFKENEMLLGTTKGLIKLTFDNIHDTKNLASSTLTIFNKFKKNTTVTKIIKNTLWLSTANCLYKASVNEGELYILKDYSTDSFLVKNNYTNLQIKCIYEDVIGNIWFGTRKKGLLKYIPNIDKFDLFNYNVGNKTGVSSKIVNTIYEDEYGVLWIGTAQGGLNKLNIFQKTFHSYQNNPFDKNSLSGNLTTSIFEDNSGYLWVATYNNSICKSTTKVSEATVGKLEFENLEHKFPLGDDNIIRSIYEDSKGCIWFGTETSIIFHNPKTDNYKEISIRKDKDIIELGQIYVIHQIDKNTMMFGGKTFATVENPWHQIERGNHKNIKANSTLLLENNKAYKALFDSKKRLWLGTHNGFLLLDYSNRKLTLKRNYNSHYPNGVNYNRVYSLKEDDKGNLWEGTFGGGLNKIKFDEHNKITSHKSYNKSNILRDNAVYGILEDNEHNFWLSTDMGICKFNIDTEVTNFFDVRDGLINNNFRQSSSFKGKSGYFYFGGLNGLTIFNPQDIHLNKLVPKIVITGLEVNNKKVKVGDTSNSILTKSISETQKITIHEDDQVLALDVIVDHSAIPSKNKLIYKLVGFNKEWTEEKTGKLTITYTNLSAGDYVLEIKAANGDGLWSEKTKKLNIKVLPPWYKTWWSYILFTALVIASIYGVFVYFIRLEKLKQNLKYEQLDKERMDMVNQNKFRFFTNISHEFRTPLSLISGPLDRVIEQNNDPANAKYLAIIQKNTKRLLSLVDQLITFRQAEQGYVNLNLTQTTLGEFIYSITEAFEDYAFQKNINFFYKVNLPNEEIIIDIEKTERILFNLLSNSFKNTEAKGSINIEANINYEDDLKIIKIDVIDTGKGIPKEKINDIFERFYQLGKEGDNNSGGGIGLAFCKSLIELLGGKISAKSKPGKETKFSIILPSKNKTDYQLDGINNEGKSFIKDWVPLVTDTIQKSTNTPKSDNTELYNLLIVEDEEDIQHFLMESLSSKYNITLANNGVEGLEKLQAQTPHLIISDVMMDQMDGFQFCEKLKTNPDTCHIPVVLLTALGEIEDTITGLELGADEYINKPFSIKELELRVDKLIKNNLRKIEHFTKTTALPDENKIEMPLRDKQFLSDTLAIIEENISDSNFGVEELALKMGLSTSQFYRRLKQLTGQVPNAYLRNFRLQRAAELLKENNGYNVAEVMYQIGIESNSYFSTSFKKKYGVSPSAYLKNNSKKV